jgi:hypothetical protein
LASTRSEPVGQPDLPGGHAELPDGVQYNYLV